MWINLNFTFNKMSQSVYIYQVKANKYTDRENTRMQQIHQILDRSK